jgi:hypothetical protein
MRTRALRAVLIAAALTWAVMVFLLLRSGGAKTPSQPPATVEQALTGFVADRFGVGYVGKCPREFPEDGDVPRGLCLAKFSGADGRVVYRVGHPFSEWAGEATFVSDASGSWHVASFDEYPPLGDRQSNLKAASIPSAGLSGRGCSQRPAFAVTSRAVTAGSAHAGSPSPPI